MSGQATETIENKEEAWVELMQGRVVELKRLKRSQNLILLKSIELTYGVVSSAARDNGALA